MRPQQSRSQLSVERAEKALRRSRGEDSNDQNIAGTLSGAVSTPSPPLTQPRQTSAEPVAKEVSECCICSGPLRGKSRYIDPHGTFCGSCAYGFFCYKRGKKWLRPATS